MGKLVPDYLKAARRARTPDQRTRLLRLHEAQRIRDQITSCTGCGLAETRTQAVPFSGSVDAKLMLVGEGPGATEDREGEPFVGASGRMLEKVLGDLGKARSDLMIFNTVCCRPPKNRRPEPYEMHACRPNFLAQIKVSRAKVGVLAGGAALDAVMQEPNHRIMHWRGRPLVKLGVVWIPTVHPAYVLRNRGDRYLLKHDLELAFTLAEDESMTEGLGNVLERLGGRVVE